jgi:hypothetical protein
MRELLLRRISPLVDRFVSEITAVVESRIEAELERMGEAIEHALSAFASEVANADSDRPDHDPVPRVRRRSNRRLPQHEERQETRPAQEADEGRGKNERPARLVAKYDPVPIRPPHLQSSRVGVIADRAKSAPHPFQRPTKPAEKPPEEPNPNANERWSTGRMLVERELAESTKHEGVLPVPRSSFNIKSGEGFNGATGRPSSKPADDAPPRAGRHCKNCGEPGRRSDTCGITHNIPKATDSVEADQ